MTSNQELLGYSKNKRKVIFDPIHSHAAIHFAETPNLRTLVEELLPRTVLKGDSMEFATDMGRMIGLTDGVKTDHTDELVYAKRKGRNAYTPFTKSRSAELSSLIATTFRRLADGSYELTSAWIGDAPSPPFPGEPHETPESRPYWSTHALVWGSQEIQWGTETTERPW